MKKKHPDIMLFAYLEAVYFAEDTSGLKPKEADRRFKVASEKLRQLTRKLRGLSPDARHSFCNEYYWFSKQPRKQYQLGVRAVKRGLKRGGYYSQGVGAVYVAKNYGLNGRRQLFLKWAKTSERAWLQFFKEDPNWFNSYFFYAMALAFQGRLTEMENALKRAAKTAGRSVRWKAIVEFRKEILETLVQIKSI